jgi:hypothetical protein
MHGCEETVNKTHLFAFSPIVHSTKNALRSVFKRAWPGYALLAQQTAPMPFEDTP